MESEFTIREAILEDAWAIANVNYLTWLHAYRGLIPDSELDSLNLEALTDQWKQNLTVVSSLGITFVAMDSGSIVAYSRFYPSVDPDDDQIIVATIGSLYVNPEFERKGIGRKLMATILEAVKRHDFKEATLHVLVNNQRARRFYEHLGWEEDPEAVIGESDSGRVSKVRYRKHPL